MGLGKTSLVVFKLFILLLVFSFPGVSFAQPGGSASDKSALKNIEKHRWQKAETTLRKDLSRSPLNPAARYAFSIFFFHPENPAYDLDSAYHYAVTALHDYSLSHVRTRERLRRIAIDSARLAALRANIDSTAFEVAKRENTEAAYMEFLRHFPSAVQRELAEHMRDEVAFQQAVKENSPQAFRRYINSYPQSARSRDAQAEYDRLLFQEATKDGRLSSYEKFLNDHPETPYKNEIDRHIFQLCTVSGTVESFLSFMDRYPSSGFVGRSRQILFHLLADEERPNWPHGFLDDSLQNLIAINRFILVPFFTNDRFGFMNENGQEIIKAVHESINENYLCGNLTGDVLIADGRLIARNGSRVFDGPIDHVTDIGLGFLKISTAGKTSLIHKGGFVLQDTVQDARILNKKFIAVRKEHWWFLYSLGGRLLDERPWDEIAAINDLVVFTRDNKKLAVPGSQITSGAEARGLILSDPFDDVKPWPQGLIWGKSGAFEGVMDQSLQGVIRFDQHQLTQTFFGAIASLRNGFALYDWTGKKSSTFERIKILGKRVGVKQNGAWYLLDPVSQIIESKPYDSVGVEGPFFLGINTDTVTVHFDDNFAKRFYQPRNIAFVPGRDSIAFLSVHTGSQKILYDLKGTRLFTANFDGIEYAGRDIFVVTHKDKKGLLNGQGKKLLPVEFDAVGTVKNGVVSVLKNKKFGAYNIETRTFIKPTYDRNVVPYSDRVITTFKGGYYGFLAWDNNPLSEFRFDEIKYWNDSLALVRQSSAWSLYDIFSQRIVEGNLRDLMFVKNTEAEKIAIVRKGDDFGVIGNGGKIMIPITFTDIINVGTAELPLYFTEKHIPEASLYVVIYYDREGNMLRKEIYDDAGDYDKIYCSDQ